MALNTAGVSYDTLVAMQQMTGFDENNIYALFHFMHGGNFGITQERMPVRLGLCCCSFLLVNKSTSRRSKTRFEGCSTVGTRPTTEPRPRR